MKILKTTQKTTTTTTTKKHLTLEEYKLIYFKN